jgi:hypothetical protein
MDLCKSVLDKILYTEISENVILYIFLGLFVFIIVLAMLFVKEKSAVFSTVPNVLRIRNTQNEKLDTFLSDFYKPKISFMESAVELASNEKGLINFVPLTVIQPGFLGPSIDGVFDEKNGVSKLIRTGIRSFVLVIDYHEDYSMKPPLYANVKMPCLLSRDRSGTIRSLNSGSIQKTCQTLADAAFGLAAPSPNDPLLLTLYFVRTPDPVKDEKGFLRYCSQVAKELAPLSQYHLGQTPLGSYRRQARQDYLLYEPLSNIEKKVLIFSNLDTSLFRTVKPSYQPKEDLDYWIHLRIFKDSVNSLGVTKPVTQNQFARGVIDTTQYFSTIPPENMAAAIDKTRMRWTTAMSDVGTNPDLTKLFPVGVQSIPISIVSLDSTEKKLLHLWNNSCWKVKPKALRFAIPPDSVPSEPSIQLNAQGGNITSPSL